MPIPYAVALAAVDASSDVGILTCVTTALSFILSKMNLTLTCSLLLVVWKRGDLEVSMSIETN